MRRFLAGVLAVTLACGAGRGFEQEFDGAAALQYVVTQLEFGPRVPNSEAHRRMGDWLAAALGQRADTVEIQAFEHVTADGDTLELRNFIARFNPAAAQRVLYVAHWDTRPRADKDDNIGERRLPVPGANDGASGVAVLLGVADVFAARPPTWGVDLLFVDGEDYGDFASDTDVLLGSRYYAARIDTTALPLFGVVWDMVGARDLRIEREWYSVRRAPEVVERVWRQARELGYGQVFVSETNQGITDDHLPLLDAGVRAIDVIGWPYPYHHTTEDTLDKVSAESLQIVGDVAVALLR